MATRTFGGGLNNYEPARIGKQVEITLMVQFKDQQDPPTATDVTDGKAFIKDIEGTTIGVEVFSPTVQNADKSYSLTLVTSPGLYKLQFLVSGAMKPGLYSAEFQGKITVGPNQHTLTVIGQFGIGEISRIDDYMNRIRLRLMDDFPDDYTLDEPVNQWRRVNVFACLRDALSRFNSTGPRRTEFTFDTYPDTFDELLVTGGYVYALESRARLEKATQMNYSDGISLNIDRGPFYLQLATGMRTDWTRAVQDWKKATPPSPRGVRSVRIPFRINRVIGMLPNYQTYFSG